MNSKKMRNWGALALFSASIAMYGYQSRSALSHDHPDTSSFKNNIPSANIVEKSVTPVEKPKKKTYSSIRSPLLKDTYKDCDPEKYAVVVIDAVTGEVLYGRNENTPRHPASLAKLMTLFLTFEEIERGRMSLDDKLKIDTVYRPNALGLTMLELDTSDVLTVREAIHALLSLSAYDATDVFAKNIGGNVGKFVKRMNDRSPTLEMENTVFTNPSGAPDPDMLSTASAMVRLMRMTKIYFPQYCDEFGIENFVYHTNHTPEKYKPPFKNRYLVNGADMGKTGYIKSSGFNIVQSIPLKNRRVDIVVMGARSAKQREHHVQELLKYVEKMDVKKEQEQNFVSDPSLINHNSRFAFMPASRSITELKDLADPPELNLFSLEQNRGLWSAIEKNGKEYLFTPSISELKLGIK